MNREHIHLNGIHGITGEYLVPPMPVADAAELAQNDPPEAGLVAWFKRIRDVLRRPFMGLPQDIDPKDVTSAGWALVFAKDTPAEVRQSLEPLIAHRRTRVLPGRCKVLEYEPGQTRADWLKKHGVHASDVNPDRVPYYVLLAGGPESIPFEFQYLLDIDYAVGRLAFDRPEQYRQYAESVAAYETATSVPNGREIVFWGPCHEGDAATRLSTDGLITPLYEGLPAADDSPGQPAIATKLTFRSRCLKAEEATRANLLDVLHSRQGAAPAMLFTASHGMGGWPKGDPRQRSAQGALLGQDWSGFGTIRPDHYVTAADVADDARLHGLVAFVFACYGAGTPAFDNFLRDRRRGPVAIAEQPFVAALPQRLLAHPRGGALAVIGHVERAWGYSIWPPDVGPQLLPFRNLIGRVLGGEPVGHATKDFSERYATLSAELVNQLDETRPGRRPSAAELAWTWVERNDAQNYVVLGDPAVRVRVDLLK